MILCDQVSGVNSQCKTIHGNYRRGSIKYNAAKHVVLLCFKKLHNLNDMTAVSYKIQKGE
jgi:hypothetical protein